MRFSTKLILLWLAIFSTAVFSENVRAEPKPPADNPPAFELRSELRRVFNHDTAVLTMNIAGKKYEFFYRVVRCRDDFKMKCTIAADPFGFRIVPGDFQSMDKFLRQFTCRES